MSIVFLIFLFIFSNEKMEKNTCQKGKYVVYYSASVRKLNYWYAEVSELADEQD